MYIVLKEVPHEMVQRASYCHTSTPMSGGAAAWNVNPWVKLFRVAAQPPPRSEDEKRPDSERCTPVSFPFLDSGLIRFHVPDRQFQSSRSAGAVSVVVAIPGHLFLSS